MRRASRPAPVVLSSDGEGPFQFVVDEFSALGLKDAGGALHTALHRVHLRLEATGGNLQAWTYSGAGTHSPVDPELEQALRILHALLHEPGPRSDSPAAIGAACLQLGEWAEERAGYRTALGFFQAAEQVAPAEARYAYKIGKMARRLAIYDAAQSWLKWASRAARVGRQWEVAALAASGLGNLYRQRGNLPLAIRHQQTAERIARRNGLRTLLGDALFDLFVLCISVGDHRQGMEYARKAGEAFGRGHPRGCELAKDIAWVWMEHYGEFESALHVFLALREQILEPRRRVMLLSSIVRAAAGAGLKSLFETTWEEVLSLLRQQPTQDQHAAALTELSRGAASLENWDRAVFAARTALGIALTRREGEAIIVAESLLHSAQTYSNVALTATSDEPGCRSLKREARIQAADVAAVLGWLTPMPAMKETQERSGVFFPDPGAQGTHTVFRRDHWSGHVVEWAAFSPASDPDGSTVWERTLRFESGGIPSFNRHTRVDVPAPHVHDGSIPGGVRTPRPDELPSASWD